MAVRKTTASKKVVKKPIKDKDPRLANKKAAEKEELMCIISIGMRKAQSIPVIMQEIKDRGLSLSRPAVYSYMKEIRAEWRSAMSENYETHVASQFAKLDLMEERLWDMLDKSMKSEKKDTVTTEKGLITGRKEESKSRHGDVEIMLAIERIWVRRNELLGITSSTINIQNNINNIENTTNVQNNSVEVTKVEFQPVSDKFHGNFIIQVADRQKP